MKSFPLLTDKKNFALTTLQRRANFKDQGLGFNARFISLYDTLK